MQIWLGLESEGTRTSVVIEWTAVEVSPNKCASHSLHYCCVSVQGLHLESYSSCDLDFADERVILKLAVISSQSQNLMPGQVGSTSCACSEAACCRLQLSEGNPRRLFRFLGRLRGECHIRSRQYVTSTLTCTLRPQSPKLLCEQNSMQYCPSVPWSSCPLILPLNLCCQGLLLKHSAKREPQR